MTVLSRVGISSEPIRLGDVRNALWLEIIENQPYRGMTILPVHLDDRNEERRLEMTEDILGQRPHILAGDLNALHANDIQAQMLRSQPAGLARDSLEKARDWHRRLFGNEAETTGDYSWPTRLNKQVEYALSRTHELVDRLILMADGCTMSRLTEFYTDADHRGRLALPTMKLGPIALVRLDHIMYESDSPYIAAARTEYRSGSDHLPVVAEVTARGGHGKTLYL